MAAVTTTGFKIRLRKTSGTSSSTTITTSTKTTPVTTWKKITNSIDDDDDEDRGRTEIKTSTNNKTSSTASNTSLSLCYTTDSILTNIAHKLNIPDQVLSTPKRNFGQKYFSTSDDHNHDDTTKSTMTRIAVENNNPGQLDQSSINTTFGHEESLYNRTGYGDTTNSTTNMMLYSRNYDLERMDARRRLELLKQSADLVRKFSRVKLEPTFEDIEDNEPLLLEPELSKDSKNKVVRAFSTNDSVVEIIHDHFEPKFVKEINFEVLKHPNSQQKITISKTDVDAALLKPKSSTSSKKKLKSSSSSSSSKVRLKPPSKDNPKLLPRNLDSKLASVSKDNYISSFSDDESAQSQNNKPSYIIDDDNRIHSGRDRISNTEVKTPSILNTKTSNKSSLKVSLTKSLSQLDQIDQDQIKNLGSPKQQNRIPFNTKLKRSNSSSQQNQKLKKQISSSDLSIKALSEEASLILKHDHDFGKLQKMANRLGSKHFNKNQQQQQIKNIAAIKHQLPSNQETTNGLKIKKISVNQKTYQVLNKIGKGGSSMVFQVYAPETQEILALKVVDLKNVDQYVVEGFRSEINVLKRLRGCSRVVQMYDYEFRNNNKELLIVMEKGDADLSTVLKSHFQPSSNDHHHNYLSPHLIRLYWQEMLEAVKEIHDKNIVHSDLKPVNFILVSGKLKLIDFGIANTIQSNQTNVYKDSIIGTVDYMAPESFQKRREHNNKVKYNQKVDIWSLGIILYNLVYGCTPFSHLGSDMFKKGMAIVNGNIEYGPINDHLLLDVIKKCLQKDPRKRPTAEELLKHPYLTDSVDSSTTMTKSNKEHVSTSNIPTELLSQISNLTPNSLRTFSKFVETFAKK